MITLTPLSSSASESSTSEPVSYYLELDDAKILLDMGQRDYRASASQTSWEYEEKIRALAPTLSLVLLSHSLSNYLGLYAYARAHWGLKCPVYATQPTVEMGRVNCLTDADSWRSECPVTDNDGKADGAVDNKGKKPLRGPFVPTLEEIHEAFDWIKATRYNQPLHLGGELSHLLLTPFPSGHVLGGTLFKIRSPTSGTVLYAVGMNHTGERHLDGMVTGQGGLTGYAEDIRRPDLLIVEGDRSLVVNPKRRDRETTILDLVTSTLESNHSVLMPCDPSPRLLELLVLLDQHWSFKLNPGGRNKPQQAPTNWNYPLCLVSRTAQDMVSFAQSLIEWMGGVVREAGVDEVVLEGGKKRGRRRNRPTLGVGEHGALDFSHVKFFSTTDDLLKEYPLDKPKLVLAIPTTMSFGPSRRLFTAMSSIPGNVILLTNRGEDRTLTRELYDKWENQQPEDAKWGRGKIGQIKTLEGPLTVEMDSKVPLTGEELEEYEEEERLKKEREAAQKAAHERSQRMLEADDLESDSDSDSEGEEDADGIVITRTEGANAFAGDSEDVRTMSFDIFVKGQQMRRDRGGAGEMARFRMFPFIAKGRKVDTYGEGLDIGQWVRKGREIEEEGETEEVREAKRRKQEEKEKALVPPEPPSKFVSEDVTLDLQANIEYVDMDGLHDAQAIKSIIADLQPRKLIVIKSTEKSTQTLLNFVQSSAAITNEVFAPGPEETIKIGEQVQSYSLQLGDSVSQILNGTWSKFEGYEVAMIDGHLAFASGSTVPVLEGLNVELPPLPEMSRAEEEVEAQPPDVTAEPATEDSRDDAKIEAAEAAEPSSVEVVEAAEAAEPISVDVVETAEDDAQAKTDATTNAPTDAPTDDGAETAAPLEAVVEAEIEPQSLEPPTKRIKRVARGPSRLPSSLFIGDLRLTALKNRLAAQQIPSEFAGEGMLVCGAGISAKTDGKGEPVAGSIVVVRKLAEGQVVIEGAISKTYFAVRKELYSSYAQVTTA